MGFAPGGPRCAHRAASRDSFGAAPTGGVGGTSDVTGLRWYITAGTSLVSPDID